MPMVRVAAAGVLMSVVVLLSGAMLISVICTDNERDQLDVCDLSCLWLL